MQWRRANTQAVAQMQAGVWNAGQVTMANLGEWRLRGEEGEELGRQKFAFNGELYSQQSFLSFYLMWAKNVIVSAEGGLTRYGMGLGCLSCAFLDMWMAACAGNVPATIFTSLFPSVGTNSPVSLQSSLLSDILLQACFVHKEYISTEGKPLWRSWQCSPLKKGFDARKEGVQASLPVRFLLCKYFYNHQSWKLKLRSKWTIRKGGRKQVGSLITRFVDYGY